MPIEAFLDYNKLIKVSIETNKPIAEYQFDTNNDNEKLSKRIIENLKTISSMQETENPDIVRLSINDTIFIDVSKSAQTATIVNQLTAFETRLLAQGKTFGVPFLRETPTDFRPKTDLHTHFAGALTPESLIKAGIKNNISYPASYLEKLGIDMNQYSIDLYGNVLLSSVDKNDIEKLKSGLIIPQITQETFMKMEDIYAMRGPFTKNKELFPELMKELARDYQSKGIEYAELSFSAFVSDPEYLQMLSDNIPDIEEETGVKLRFLAGLWRHSDKEWNLDDVDRIKSVAKSPYIVGCDFMGHETNSTEEFMEELQELARYAISEDPNFAIRVHAGENPMFKDNVKKALQIVYDEHAKVEEETGQKQKMPQVRIGHGLYGVDETVLEMAKKMGAIIEFNMSSNLALNNINAISEIPIKYYIDQGIDVVLCTDGHGLYSTSGEQEVLLAQIAGLKRADFEKIKVTEEKVIEKAKEREYSKDKIDDIKSLYNIKYSTSNGEKRYTKEVAEEYSKSKMKASEHLGEKIKHTGAITDEEQITKDTEGKIPILITGASKSNWPNIKPEDQKDIKVLMQVLADTIDPNNAYIVTGGTNYGVEKQMHEAGHRRNSINEDKLVMLGTLTMEATKDDTGDLDPDTITHATILELDGKKANTWQELPDTQLDYVQQRNGAIIAVGGGGVVNDMIQRAHNMGLDINLMDGPYGASTNKSISLAGNDYSFKTSEELLLRLYNKSPKLFKEDFSLDKMEEYIKAAELKISNTERIYNYMKPDPANFGLGAIEEAVENVSKEERLSAKSKMRDEIRDEMSVIANEEDDRGHE